MTLLPVAPLILLPFAVIFFVAVFPVWLVAMIVLGLARLAVRGVVRRPDQPVRVATEKAFDWVKSFGGLIHYESEGSPRT